MLINSYVPVCIVCVCVNTPCMVLISVLITGNSQVVTLFPGRLG